MKCQFCGKNLDEVDCSCGWCTVCGWSFDAKSYAPPKDKPQDE